MPALSAYIRGFERTPEDARNYIADTNAILTSAFADFGIDETAIVAFQWVPYNQYIWCVVVYK